MTLEASTPTYATGIEYGRLVHSTLDGTRQTLQRFAADKVLSAALDDRLAADDMTPPALLEHAKTTSERALGRQMSWASWLGHAATNTQLEGVLEWNAEVAHTSDDQWQDEAFRQYQSLRTWLDRRAQGPGSHAAAYQRMIRRLPKNGVMPCIIIGAPLDGQLANAWGYYQAPSVGNLQARVMRRNYPTQVLAHEIIHGLGGYANRMLNEGTAQHITSLYANQSDTIRAELAQLSYKPDYQRTALDQHSRPEDVYPEETNGIRRLSDLLSTVLPYRHFYIENSFAKEGRAAAQKELQASSKL
jgi:hypothetical protein